MSGGYLNNKGLKTGEHQVLVFNFKGGKNGIPPTACKDWNQVVRYFKKNVFGDNLISVTLTGEKTPGKLTFGKNIVLSGVRLGDAKKRKVKSSK